MNCEEAKSLLLSWHFSELEDRGPLEAHLTTCPSCMNEFVTLKRAVELAEGEPLPSAASRKVLRNAVSAELETAWGWWERPLAFALAATAMWFGVFLVTR